MSDSLPTHGLQCARPPCPSATQTHVHWVGDAIQPSHPLSSPSPPAFNLSQHQGLFKLVTSSHQEAKVLEFQLQHLSFQWIFRTGFLQDGLLGSPCSPRDSQEVLNLKEFQNFKSTLVFTSLGCQSKYLSFPGLSGLCMLFQVIAIAPPISYSRLGSSLNDYVFGHPFWVCAFNSSDQSEMTLSA